MTHPGDGNTRADHLYRALGPAPFVAMGAWPTAIVLTVLAAFNVVGWHAPLIAALVPPGIYVFGWLMIGMIFLMYLTVTEVLPFIFRPVTRFFQWLDREPGS